MPSMLSEIERDALVYMRDNIARVMRFVQGLDLYGFLTDEKSFYAATRCLEIIRGVAAAIASVQGTVSDNSMEDLPVPGTFTVTTTRMFGIVCQIWQTIQNILVVVTVNVPGTGNILPWNCRKPFLERWR